jgi:hypothetical protein
LGLEVLYHVGRDLLEDFDPLDAAVVADYEVIAPVAAEACLAAVDAAVEEFLVEEFLVENAEAVAVELVVEQLAVAVNAAVGALFVAVAEA